MPFGNVTVTIRISRILKLRARLGVWLIGLGCRILRCKFNYERE